MPISCISRLCPPCSVFVACKMRVIKAVALPLKSMLLEQSITVLSYELWKTRNNLTVVGSEAKYIYIYIAKRFDTCKPVISYPRSIVSDKRSGTCRKWLAAGKRWLRRWLGRTFGVREIGTDGDGITKRTFEWAHATLSTHAHDRYHGRRFHSLSRESYDPPRASFIAARWIIFVTLVDSSRSRSRKKVARKITTSPNVSKFVRYSA